MPRVIHAADLFCGAGGTSTGMIRACEALGLKTELVAVNHWEIAVSTHAANHPGVNHLCASLDALDPRKAVPGGRLDLLMASPECTHHSIARGGRPCSDQSRATAWCVLRWIDALRPKAVLVENVKEFASWGPLDDDGKPVRALRGETYKAFIQAIRSMGYNVEARILNAADYGDATTRRRLFIMARLGNAPIMWPMATHGPTDNGVKRWRSAREIIDWSILGTSIFNRQRPLAPRTLDRIEYGLKKFGGEAAEPFLVLLKGQSQVRSVREPIPTVTATPWLYLCDPFILPQHRGRKGQVRVKSIDEPLPTITSHGAEALVSPFIVKFKGTGKANDIQEPLHTITAGGGNFGLVEPFLVKYYGQSKVQSLGKPLSTVVTKDRFGLVKAILEPYLDITLRMLQPHELAAAMSFPDGYRFTGTKSDQFRQIGNAVPVYEAEALCRVALGAA